MWRPVLPLEVNWLLLRPNTIWIIKIIEKKHSRFFSMCWFFCIWLFPIISMKKFIHNFKNIQKAKYCPQHLAADLDSTSPLRPRRNCKNTNLFRIASFEHIICFVEISYEFCTLHIFAVQCAKQTIGLSDLLFVWNDARNGRTGFTSIQLLWQNCS